MNRVLLAGLIGIVGVSLAGCSAGTPAATGSGATPGFVGSPQDVAAAAAAVRAGAELPKPIARVAITGGKDIVGVKAAKGFFVVYSVTTSTSSTVLRYGLERAPGGTGTDVPSIGQESEPSLVVGPTAYHAIRWYDGARSAGAGNSWPVAAQPPRTYSPARAAASVLYPALPQGTTQVRITSPLFGEMTVAVTNPEHPQGTSAVPIRGRVVYQSAVSEDVTNPLIVSVHSVRRVPGATAVYYSVAFPERTTPSTGTTPSIMPFSSTNNLLARIPTYRVVSGSFGLIDRASMKAYSQITPGIFDTQKRGLISSTSSINKGLEAGSVMGGIAILPELPAGTSTVDVMVGATQFIQDVPVDEGALGSAGGATQAELGTAWPTFNPDAVKSLTAADTKDAVWSLYDRVTEEAVTTGNKTLDLDANVLFEFNKATLTPNARRVIDKAVEKIKASSRTGVITVTGYTDNVGSKSFNLALSRKRAAAVVAQLTVALPSGYTFVAVGKGETNPVGSNSTAAGRALNRRVELTLP